MVGKKCFKRKSQIIIGMRRKEEEGPRYSTTLYTRYRKRTAKRGKGKMTWGGIFREKTTAEKRGVRRIRT